MFAAAPALLAVLMAVEVPLAPAYDPLRVGTAEPKLIELSVQDSLRQREIPIRVYLPETAAPAAVILYSHGLGGSRATSKFLGEHWAKRGYVAVFLQHPGSDESVWKGKPLREMADAMEAAASVEQFLARVRDVPAVIDALAKWNSQPDHPLRGRMDLTKLGMSGHSFGAVTAQALGGALSSTGRSYADPRIQADAIFSPSVPKSGDAAAAFGAVKIPWLLMTGTKDAAPVSRATAESRRGVFTALPPGHKYELVLDGAEHSVFTDRALPGESGERNPKHHPAIEAITTAFFDTYLRGDADAKAWLDGAGVKTVLDAKDQWQKK